MTRLVFDAVVLWAMLAAGCTHLGRQPGAVTYAPETHAPSAVLGPPTIYVPPAATAAPQYPSANAWPQPASPPYYDRTSSRTPYGPPALGPLTLPPPPGTALPWSAPPQGEPATGERPPPRLPPVRVPPPAWRINRSAVLES